MKRLRMITLLGAVSLLALTSCKKNYTCTCTTVVGPASNTSTHSVDDAYYNDAKNTCNNYQSQANETVPNSTTCHL